MERSNNVSNPIGEEVIGYYNQGGEAERLFKGIGPLEQARTRELIQRYFPQAPAVVYDIAGGSGVYARWLARQGYQVHLLDIVPLHIEQARQADHLQHPLASFTIGDARYLDFPDESADAVLLLGPLYHLTAAGERHKALREAWRVLRPGGVMLAAAISRYASTNVGLVNWWLGDADYLTMVDEELTTGIHTQPETWPFLFTTGYFHLPQDLRTEVESAGFDCEAVLAIEGQGWLVKDYDKVWEDETQREILLSIVRRLEQDPVSLGMSPHLMAVGKKG
jgi:ubiquinone/menaquinone biosynthesis C-methylase UbiE